MLGKYLHCKRWCTHLRSLAGVAAGGFEVVSLEESTATCNTHHYFLGLLYLLQHSGNSTYHLFKHSEALFSTHQNKSTRREEEKTLPCRDSNTGLPARKPVAILTVCYPHNVLWHEAPLLGSDREISNYTTTVRRQRSINSNRGKVFSVRFVPRCYKQDKSGVVVTDKV
jgi:hypothetical protein